MTIWILSGLTMYRLFIGGFSRFSASDMYVSFSLLLSVPGKGVRGPGPLPTALSTTPVDEQSFADAKTFKKVEAPETPFPFGPR